MIIEIRAHAIREKGGKAERFSYQRALGFSAGLGLTHLMAGS